MYKDEPESGAGDSVNRRKPKGKKKFTNKEGEQDLSVASGPEAVKAFASMGLKFPVIHKGNG